VHVERGDLLRDLRGVANAQTVDLIARKGADGNGDLLEAFAAFVGGDDDLA